MSGLLRGLKLMKELVFDASEKTHTQDHGLVLRSAVTSYLFPDFVDVRLLLGSVAL